MKKRDRIARAVATILIASELEPEDQLWLQGQFVQLLRREATYRRARVRRIVQRLPRYGFDALINPYDVLAKLKEKP